MTAASTDTIGLGRRVNYALALDVWPAGCVSRATLRALLPPGDHRADGTNRTQSALKQHLALCEARGFVKRGRVLVAVLEPQRLLENAVRGLAEVRCGDFLCLQRAAEVIEDQLASEEMPAGLRQRRAAELHIIQNMAKS